MMVLEYDCKNFTFSDIFLKFPVATARGHVFVKLLGRWKASVYKLLWKDLAAFLVIFYFLHIVYWFWLDDAQKKIFEGVVEYCSRYRNYIPLSFVLGFFVTNVMNRYKHSSIL